MLLGVHQANLSYHMQTLNYRSKCLICHNYITSPIMEIAVSLQDSCTSERKYAVLLFPWIFFFPEQNKASLAAASADPGPDFAPATS